ncbi:hypothetical protein SODG_006566 [Sodalis praecaptivus]
MGKNAVNYQYSCRRRVRADAVQVNTLREAPALAAQGVAVALEDIGQARYRFDDLRRDLIGLKLVPVNAHLCQ